MVEAVTLPERFDLGTEPSAAKLASVDIDVNPAGAGLPQGSGNAAKGALVYARQCAACHGVAGEGVGPYPRLIGVEHQNDFAFGDDPKYVKTIGNYWPHATTLYDYINRAMPHTAPLSLPPDEVYSVVAFLLAQNGIIAADAVIDRETLPRVRMPSRERFVPDDRIETKSFR
ncbi:MAG: c-type cytochrome [Gemmatimonadaceae bacterium]